MKLKDANYLTDDEIAELLDFADTLQGWIKSIRNEGFKRASRKTGSINGWKIGEPNSDRDWAIPPEEVPQKVIAEFKLAYDDLFSRSLKSVPQIEALLKTKYKGRGHKEIWDKFKKLVDTKKRVATALVRDTDPRKEVKRGDEFKDKIAKHDKTDIDDLL